VFAAEYDLNDYEVVQVAISEFLALRRFAYEHDLKPEEVEAAILAFLKSYKDKQ